jgi:hypothetical protein
LIDRRSHPRIEVSHTALYRKDVYSRPTIASILDLSLGGTKIETLFDMRSGDKLEITIGIPPQAIRCRGKVIHVSLPENGKVKAGMQFDELLAHDKLYLGQHLLDLMEKRS